MENSNLINQPLLELRDIGMAFDAKSRLFEGQKKLQVLRHINLKINQGEIVVLVGESGCGKTTIGKIITGLVKPTEGKLLFLGRNMYHGFFGKKQHIELDYSKYEEQVKGLNEAEKRKFFKKEEKAALKRANERFKNYRNSVQFVQQDSYAALNPALTIYQSLYAPIKSKNKKWSRKQIDEKIEELMKLVGLFPVEQYLFKYPHQLSGGQRQRILMARAVSLDPKLIVADEPVSMIDVSLRLSILNLMQDLNKKFGISFVYITHDLSTARYIAYKGKICVMYLGEIVEMGAVQDVIKDPKHPYTQALFTAVPIPDPEISRIHKPIPIKSMEIGSLINRKNGCPFYERCLYAEKDCERIKIEYKNINDVDILCKHLEKVAKWTQE